MFARNRIRYRPVQHQRTTKSTGSIATSGLLRNVGVHLVPRRFTRSPLRRSSFVGS